MRVGSSALRADYAKLVIASKRSDQQRDPLKERRVVCPIQFEENTDSEDESKDQSPDNFADYIVELHS